MLLILVASNQLCGWVGQEHVRFCP